MPGFPVFTRPMRAGYASGMRHNATTIRAVIERLSRAIPEPKTELEYTNPFTLLVAVVLSAQATDKGVNKATAHLFPVADTPEKMLALGEARVREYIKSINFNNAKARNVIGLSEALIRDHGSQVPRDRKALVKLPGVGEKTASVVLNTVFGEPTIAVDTHVFRVSHRLGIVSAAATTPDKVEAELTRKIPLDIRHDAHHLLILHGRYTCKAQRPLCGQCPLTDLCRWFEIHQPLSRPVKKPAGARKKAA